jgi:hypothetical protein
MASLKMNQDHAKTRFAVPSAPLLNGTAIMNHALSPANTAFLILACIPQLPSTT